QEVRQHDALVRADQDHGVRGEHDPQPHPGHALDDRAHQHEGDEGEGQGEGHGACSIRAGAGWSGRLRAARSPRPRAPQGPDARARVAAATVSVEVAERSAVTSRRRRRPPGRHRPNGRHPTSRCAPSKAGRRDATRGGSCRTTVPALSFHDGATVPQLGYGVWQVEDDVAADVVVQAVEAGYRHIDTAAGYENEGGVGRAVKDAGVPREDLCITTKLANGDQGFDSATQALETSLSKLGTDYVDLYLIHWASPQRGKYLESWKALIELQKEGKATSIGVSNFPIA